MAGQKGTPAWYAQGGADVSRKRPDTEAAQGVVEEARALLFKGLTPAQVRKEIGARGGGRWVIGIVNRASRLEWDAVVRAASTDVDAGETSTPNVAIAKRLALEITREDPSGGDFKKKLSQHGASDGLAGFLAADPEVNQTARESGKAMVIWGCIGLLAVVLAFAFLGAMNNAPALMGAILVASVTGIWRGVAGMNRKTGRSGQT